jgi:hypothetical protein
MQCASLYALHHSDIIVIIIINSINSSGEFSRRCLSFFTARIR